MTKKVKTSQILVKPHYKGIRLFFGRLVLWLYTKTFTLGLTLIGSLLFRSRMSHYNAIGASGKVTILDNPKLPPHPFFEANKSFDCRIRHGSASFRDDAMRAVRSISIKFADTAYKSPFDLELNTGKVALFWSVASFMRFGVYKKTKYGIQYHQYYKNYPAGVRGAQVGMRRNPTSFSNLHYYSQTPLFYISEEVKHYAKYRVVPFYEQEETGILDDYDMTIPVENQRILPGEQRTRNYLKEEYQKRVAQKEVVYKLQVQLHKAQPDDSEEIFNCCREWDLKTHPWLDLAKIEINKTLNWKDSSLLAFSLNNLPKGLGVLPANSIYDYNSLNYMRSHSEMARISRVWSYKVFGVPGEIPDDDNRNE